MPIWDRRRLHRALPWLGWTAAAGMFVVLVMGATVTSTGSAEGCGRDWPLCHGRFIPDFAVATAIEFSHRAVTGLEGILIVAFAAGALLFHRDRSPIRFLVPLMLGFLVLQAGMGAWAVKYPQQAVVLALHFGISLVALASTALTAVYVHRLSRGGPPPAPTSPALRAGTWGAAAYVYVVVYSGAYIRHAAAAAACPGWPLCSPSAAPPAEVAINLAHRVLAGGALAIACALLLAYSRAAPGGRLGSGARVLIGALLLQGAAGAYLVLSGWGLIGELLHAAVTGLVFTAAAYLCMEVTLGAKAPQPAPVTATIAGGDGGLPTHAHAHDPS